MKNESIYYNHQNSSDDQNTCPVGKGLSTMFYRHWCTETHITLTKKNGLSKGSFLYSNLILWVDSVQVNGPTSRTKRDFHFCVLMMIFDILYV